MSDFNRSAPRLAVVTTIALSLAGCISLLPKDKPVQLYRFGSETPPPVSAAASTATRFTVRNAEMTFDRAASGDRILTTEGDQAAYIAGGRWVGGAFSLYGEAVAQSFAFYGGPARLLAPGEPTRADYTLKLDVRTFEARYEHGRNAPPTVKMVVYAALDGTGNHPVDAQRTFEASVPASENRVGAIANAFGSAVDSVNRDLVAWVGARGSS
jgi:cholesterol transport system auxiliary component